jgi:hypothetical protein
LCLIDTILMFIQYQYYSAKGDGPRDALRRIARLRFAGTAPAIARAPADQIELRAYHDTHRAEDCVNSSVWVVYVRLKREEKERAGSSS